MRKRFVLTLFFVLTTILGWAAPSSLPEIIPTTGRDFWLTYMDNFDANNSFVKLRLYVVADTTADVVIMAGDGTLLDTHTVPAGTTYTYTMPDAQRTKAYLMSSGLVENKSVHVTSNHHVAVYMSNTYDNGTALSYDASPVYTTSSLGKEYVAQTYYSDLTAAEFALVATEANTNVRIVLSHAAAHAGSADYAAGQVLNVTLPYAGSTYLLQAVTDGDGVNTLSGTTIMADKPVALFNGGVMATVPYDNGAGGDHLVEQSEPISAWGKRYILPEFHGFPAGNSSTEATQYSVTAIYDHTSITCSDGTSFVLDAGETSTDMEMDQILYLDVTDAPKFLEADKPVMVQAYMTNGTANKTAGSALLRKNVGEPSMILIPSVRQGMQRAVFNTFVGSAVTGEAHQYVTIVVPDSAKANMMLNGAAIPASTFTTLPNTFAGRSERYAWARIEVPVGYNVLENSKGPFLSYAYGVKVGSAESYGMVTTFNLAPAAPEVYIDDVRMNHMDTIDYCNSHPGIHFKGLIDYPHDNVKWEFGDGETSSSASTSHMYALMVGEETETNTVRFVVTRHDPLSLEEHKDTVQVTLLVHPTYYDTLRTTICGKEGSYVWNGSSHGVPFNTKSTILNNAKQAADGKVTYTGFTKSTNTHIFDSIVYHTTSNDCDSIFYLDLTVVSEIVKPAETASVCQGEAFTWTNHTNVGVNHLYKGGVAITTIPTDVAGTFTVVDSMVSEMGCDSIESLILTVHPKPTVGITSVASVCQTTAPSTEVAYSSTNAATYSFVVRDATDAVKTSGTAAAVASGTFTINTSTWAPGVYTLYMKTISDKGCESVEQMQTFEVYPRPTLTLNPVAAICYTDETTVSVAYSSSDATTYSYQLLQGSTVKKSAADVAIGTSYTIDVAGLTAGTYTLKMTVKSAHDCVSEEKTTDVVINAKPTMQIGTIANICREEATVLVPYTTNDAATFEYVVKNASDVVVASASDVTAQASADLSLSTATWSAGTYTITMKAASATCESLETSKTFTIYPKPTATLSAISDICLETANVTSNYTSTDAATYKWRLLDESSVQKATGTGTAATAGTITVATATLPAGAYTLELYTTSDKGCVSDTASVSFTINKLPTADITTIADICAGENASVDYTSYNATTYSYTLYQGSTPLSVTGSAAAAASGTFSLATSGLAAGTYTLHFATQNGTSGCESPEVTKTFTINPVPTISLSPLAAICQTTDASVEVAYTATNAATYTYSLKDASNNEVANGTGSVSSPQKFTLATGSLADGTYTLYITATSNKGCVSTEASTTLTVNPRPTLNITSVGTICYGTGDKVQVNYSSANAYYYSFQLLQGSTVKKSDTDRQVDAYFDLDIAGLAAGDYTLKMTVKSLSGCVSEEQTATVTIYPKPTVTISSVSNICQGEATVSVPYTTTYAATYDYEVKNATNAEVAAATDQTASNNGSFNLSTATFPAGTYTIFMTAKSANACESDEVTRTFTIHPTYEMVEAATICDTGEKTWRGQHISGLAARVAPYKYYDSLTTIYGCDSVYVLELTVNSTAPIETNATICHGETYDWVITHPCTGQPYTLMKNLNATCVQFDTIRCPGADCNSVFKLNLTVLPIGKYTEEKHQLCEGETYVWRGETITEPGVYTTTDGVDADGCPKFYRLTATRLVPASQNTYDQICYGEDYIFNGHTYSSLAAGTYTLRDTINSVGGCDSIYLVLTLKVGQPYQEEETIVACDSYTWRGHTYTTSGDYTDSYTSVYGCDSTYTLHLTIHPSYHFVETYNLTATQLPFTVHEHTYASAGTYTCEFNTVSGCDSVYTITINLLPAVLYTDTLRATTCQGTPFDWWRGGSYAVAGQYTKQDADSTHVLCLTVNPSYNKTIYEHSCGTPVYGHTTSGTYTIFSGTSVTGCDSVVTMVLEVGTPNTYNAGTANACIGRAFSWGGHTIVPTAGPDVVLTQTLVNVSGCDSVVSLTVHPVPQTFAPVENATICQGDEYNWRGHDYTIPGTYFDTITSGGACGTIYQLNLTVNPTYIIDADVEARVETLPFAWRDTTLRTDGDYYRRYTSTVTGCDSIYHIHFHVVPTEFVTRDTITRAECGSYTWAGHTYDETGLYSDTVWVGGRYDVVHFLDLTIKHGYEHYETEIVTCDNEPVYWHCDYYNASGTLLDTLTAVNGCDSIIHTHLVVYNHYTAPTENATICQGELYNWRGQLFADAGHYEDTLSSLVTGCDSIFSLDLTVTPRTAPDTVNQTMCNLASIDWEGFHIANVPEGDHQYYKYYTPAGECETFHMLNLHVYAVTPDTTRAAVCYGESYDWRIDTDNDGTLDRLVQRGIFVPGFQYDTITDGACKKVYVLDLKVAPAPTEQTEQATLCQDATYSWRGQNFNAAGTYHDTIVSTVTGCDSIIYTLNLTDVHFTTIPSAIHRCYGETYTWPFNGHTYTASAVDTFHVASTVTGCDSILYTLNLTIDPAPLATEETVVECADHYVWNGITYTASGDYTTTYTSSLGCDSTVTLHLTIGNPQTFTETKYIKPSQLPYTWREGTYTAAGTYHQDHNNYYGCDSNYVLTLIVAPQEVKTDTVQICEGGSVVVNASTWSPLHDTTITRVTADTIFATRILVGKKYNYVDHMYVCAGETFTWHGSAYSFAADDQVVLNGTSVCGCDSNYTLNVHVYPTAATSASMQLCQGEPFVWGPYAELLAPGTYSRTATFTSQLYGCDSTVNMTVTVLGPHLVNAEEAITICDNELPYAWRGHSLTEAGWYGDTIPYTVSGCDSVLSSIRLTVNRSFYQYDDVEIVEGATYAWEGHTDSHGLVRTFTTEGTYFDSLHTIQGCDSVYELHLHLNFYDRDTLHMTDADAVCETFTWRGHTYTATGLYTDTVKSATPQQIHYLDLEVKNKVYGPTETVVECATSYTWNGQSYSTSGNYTKTLTAANGCDSIVSLNLKLCQNYSYTDNVTVCEEELPYAWQDTLLRTNGVYTRSFTTVNGCDSVRTLFFSVNDSVMKVETATINEGETYTWRGLTISGLTSQATPYPYYKTLNNTPAGCDSTALLLLSVGMKNIDTVTICFGETYTWNSEMKSSSGYYEKTLTSTVNGADSIDALQLIVLPEPVTLPVESHTICPGSSFVLNGHAYTTAGDFIDTAYYHLTSCDSVYTQLHIVVSDTSAVTEPVARRFDTEPCYVWNTTTTLCDPGVYNMYKPNADGCDTRHIVPVQVFHRVDTVLDLATHCAGESYTFNFYGVDTTVILGATTMMYDTVDLVDPTLVDTIHFLSLELPSLYTSDTTVYVLKGTANWQWPGHTPMKLDAPGSPSEMYANTSAEGVLHYYDAPSCDSIYRLELHVIAPLMQIDYDTVCHNEAPYAWDIHPTQVLTTLTPGTIMLNDSTVKNFGTAENFYRYDTLYLTVSDTFATALPDTVVWQNALFEFCGSTINTSTPHTEELMAILPAANGCDSVVTQTMCISPFQKTTETICYGETYPWIGLTIDHTVDTIVTRTNPYGCDSVYQLVLTMVTEPIDNATEYVFAASLPYVWPSHFACNAYGTFYDTTYTATGCEAEYHTVVVLNKPVVVTDTTICPGDNFTWNGMSYTAPASATAAPTTAQIEQPTQYLQLVLRAHDTFRNNQTITIYKGDPAFEWKNEHGATMRTFTTEHKLIYNNDSVFTSTVTGCDSIYHLNLTIIGDTTIEKTDSLCEGAPLQTWTEAHLAVLPDTLPTLDSLYIFHSTKTVSADSVVVYKWNFFVGKSYSTVDYDTITVGDTAYYHGQQYINLGEGSHLLHYDLLTINGCDSTFLDSLEVLPKLVVDTFISVYDTICDGDIYTWVVDGLPVDPDGYYLSTPSTRMYNKLNATGDTLYHYDLTLSVRYATVLRTDTLLPYGGSIDWADLHGNIHTFTTATSFRDTLHYAAGCDSVIQVFNLTIAPEAVHVNLFDTVCLNEPFTYHGETYDTSVAGNFSHVDRSQNTAGADSITTFTLTVVEPAHFDSVAVIHPFDGTTYTWNGYTFHAGQDTLLTFTGTSAQGCDSVATLRVVTGLLSNDTTFATICSDEDTYHWVRQAVDTVINPAQTGLYTATQHTFVAGVDSVFILSLTKLTTTHEVVNETVCPGGLYASDAVVFTSVPYTNYACDSVVTEHHIHVAQTYNLAVYDTVPEGGAYRFGDTWLTNVQQPDGYFEHILGPETFTSSEGCDSTVTLHLYVAPKYAFRDTVIICEGDSYTWQRTGQTYTPDRAVNFTYSQHHTSSLGMDSTYYLTLVVKPTYEKVENIAIAQDSVLRWRSHDYSVAGTYTDAKQSMYGCDSTFTLNLYVGRISTDTLRAATCDNEPYHWMSGTTDCGTYTTAGLHYYTETYPLGGGATFDSILVLDLTINPSYIYQSEYTVPQDSLFVWSTDGQTYPTDQLGTFPLSFAASTAEGCDSLYFLDLHVEPTYLIDLYDTVCVLQTQPNIQGFDSLRTEYLHTVAGFDSIVNHHLFIHGVQYVEVTDTTCRHSGYMWRGQDVSLGTPGDNFFASTAQTSYGCDTVFELRLFLHPDTLINSFDTIADSQTNGYMWRDTTIMQDLSTGIYMLYDSLLTIHGCDSVFAHQLVVRPTYTIDENRSICDNQTVVWENCLFVGANYDGAVDASLYDAVYDGLTEGLYYDTVRFKTTPSYASQPLYDSIRTVVVTVNPTYYVNLPDTIICPSENVQIGDTLINEKGEHEIVLHSMFGCDSICHIVIDHFKDFDTTFIDTVCFATSYPWEDSTYYYVAGGTYTDVRQYTTIHGCDSILRLQLTVENLYTTYPMEEACLNDKVTWTHRRPISLTDSVDIEIEIFTPDTVGMIMYIDTVVSLLGCEYYDTLYIDVVEPVIVTSATADELCPEELVDMIIHYTKDDQGGDAREYYLYYSDAAKAQGFQDVEAGQVTSQDHIDVDLYFTKDFFPQADTYQATLYLSNGSCQDTSSMSSIPFTFDVLYPSWFAEQHWNDVLGVLSPAYTANQLKPEGYEFVAYQWYLNGQPIDDATSPLLYYLHSVMLPYGHDSIHLSTSDEIQVLLTDATGRSILTCPINPEVVADHAMPQDYYFAVTPTFVDRNNPVTNIISNTTGEYIIYDAAGKRIAMGTIQGCEHQAMEIELPYVPGTYLLWMKSDTASPITGKPLVRTVKLLVY